PEDVGVPAHHLLDDAAGDVLDVERVLGALLRQPGVEVDLEQQVAQLLAQVAGSAVRLVEMLDRLDDLVALLDQVAHERAVGLLPVPRALAPQPVHDLDQREQAGVRPAGGAGVGHEQSWVVGSCATKDWSGWPDPAATANSLCATESDGLPGTSCPSSNSPNRGSTSMSRPSTYASCRRRPSANASSSVTSVVPPDRSERRPASISISWPSV